MRTLEDNKTGLGVVMEAIGGSVRVVAASGELDIATVAGFRDALRQVTEERPSGLVVDLSQVTFVDSVTVGAILQTKRRLDEGGRLAIVVPAKTYAGLIFDVVGADAIVDVFETRAEALAHVLG